LRGTDAGGSGRCNEYRIDPRWALALLLSEPSSRKANTNGSIQTLVYAVKKLRGAIKAIVTNGNRAAKSVSLMAATRKRRTVAAGPQWRFMRFKDLP
jgi:hypothetical protein